MRVLFAVSLLGAVVGFAGTARADLPPPPGTKFVSYAFTVANVASFKDFALIAYPCSTASGAPVAAVTEVREGAQISVGRRGGNCPIFAVTRADLDAFRAANPSDDSPAWRDFVKSPKAHACSGGPEVVITLPTSDPRDKVVQALRVTQLDATTCVLGSTDAASPASASPAVTAKADPTSASPPPASHGCAGCATSAGDAASAGLLGSAILALGIATRRRRRST